MATDISTDYTGNFDQAQTNTPGRVLHTRARYFNCATDNLAATTEYKIMKLETNDVIEEIVLVIATGETATIAFGLDSGTVNTLAADYTLTTAGVIDTNAGGTTKITKTRVTAADWLTMYPSAALDSGLFWVIVRYYKLDTNMRAVAV